MWQSVSSNQLNLKREQIPKYLAVHLQWKLNATEFDPILFQQHRFTQFVKEITNPNRLVLLLLQVMTQFGVNKRFLFLTKTASITTGFITANFSLHCWKISKRSLIFHRFWVSYNIFLVWFYVCALRGWRRHFLLVFCSIVNKQKVELACLQHDRYDRYIISVVRNDRGATWCQSMKSLLPGRTIF